MPGTNSPGDYYPQHQFAGGTLAGSTTLGAIYPGTTTAGFTTTNIPLIFQQTTQQYSPQASSGIVCKTCSRVHGEAGKWHIGPGEPCDHDPEVRCSDCLDQVGFYASVYPGKCKKCDDAANFSMNQMMMNQWIRQSQQIQQASPNNIGTTSGGMQWQVQYTATSSNSLPAIPICIDQNAPPDKIFFLNSKYIQPTPINPYR